MEMPKELFINPRTIDGLMVEYMLDTRCAGDVRYVQTLPAESEIERLRAENESLRKELEKVRDSAQRLLDSAHAVHVRAIDAADAELTRLTRENSDLRKANEKARELLTRIRESIRLDFPGTAAQITAFLEATR